MRTWILVTSGAVLVAALSGCGEEVAGPGSLSPALGIVAWDDPPPSVVESVELESGGGWSEDNWGARPPLLIPEGVEAGVPFEVIATTARPNGCWYPGEHEKEVIGQVATITVYDYRTDADACPLVFSWTVREVGLQFDEAGEALIRLVGRRIEGEQHDGGNRTVVEATIVVH